MRSDPNIYGPNFAGAQRSCLAHCRLNCHRF